MVPSTGKPPLAEKPRPERVEAAGLALSSGEATAYRLKASDPITVYLRGILPQDVQMQDVIDENGRINLPYIGTVQAAGKTTSELEAEIQRLYIEGKIYKHVTVNVVMLSQGYFVRGEVKQPGRYDLVTGVTVVQAIAQAGGYTEFKDPRHVRLIRSGKTTEINVLELEADPRKDISIESGDVIVVPRGIW
jgi:polysaccharide biosynthesis/export protein VpsN